MSDLIERQDAIDVICMEWCCIKNSECQHVYDIKNGECRYCDGCDDVDAIKALPSAQPEQTTERKKQNIIRMIEDGITATSAKDVYSCGVRNGMRWCKALLDDKEPEYEDAQPETCEGCKHLDKYENEVEYGYPSPCTCCKRRVEDYYER